MKHGLKWKAATYKGSVCQLARGGGAIICYATDLTWNKVALIDNTFDLRRDSPIKNSRFTQLSCTGSNSQQFRCLRFVLFYYQNSRVIAD